MCSKGPSSSWMVTSIGVSLKKPLPKQGLFLKAGEAIRTPGIHVGNVQPHRSEDIIIRADFLRWWQGCH